MFYFRQDGKQYGYFAIRGKVDRVYEADGYVCGDMVEPGSPAWIAAESDYQELLGDPGIPPIPINGPR